MRARGFVVFLGFLTLGSMSAWQAGCRSPDQPTPAAWPLQGVAAKFPYFGELPPSFIRLPLTTTNGLAWDVSEDGKVVVGEQDLGDTTGKHWHGVRWERTSTSPLTYALVSIPFLPSQTMNNVALAISPEGVIAAGDASVTGQDPTDTAAYTHVSGRGSVQLPFLDAYPHVAAEARDSSSIGERIVGHVGTTTRTDISTNAPAVAVVWDGPPNTKMIREVDTGPGRLPNSRAYGVSKHGRAVVGRACSPESLTAYPDVSVASEAVLYEDTGGSPQFTRRLLGFPAGIARKYSQALAVVTFPGTTNSYLVVGSSGGTAEHSTDIKPSVWHVTPTNIASNQIPLLKASAFVEADTQAGVVDAVSEDCTAVVGMCSAVDAGGGFVSYATIWRDSTGVFAFPRAQSIQEILINAGVPDLQDVTLYSATGISKDGRVVCGQGLDEDGLLFAWVARLPSERKPHVFKILRLRKWPPDLFDPLGDPPKHPSPGRT